MKINFAQVIWNYFWIVIALPIVVFYVKSKIYKRLSDNKNKTQKESRELKSRQDSHSDKILLCSDVEYYEGTKAMFNTCIKSGVLSKREIFYIRNLINSLIGESALKHYEKFKFKNEAHEIYVKLKCSYLEKSDFIKIHEYLEECCKCTKEKEGIV